jgi:hypothetical protein
MLKSNQIQLKNYNLSIPTRDDMQFSQDSQGKKNRNAARPHMLKLPQAYSITHKFSTTLFPADSTAQRTGMAFHPRAILSLT